MQRTFGSHCLNVLSLFILILFMSTKPSFAKDREGKFLMIHLDGISAEVLFDELAGGHLPHLAELAKAGQSIKYGVTGFPGETPPVMSRLKAGLGSSEGIVGWAYVDPATGEIVNVVEVFLQMLSHIDRLSHHQYFLKFPILTELVGVSLLNLDRLWETHDLLEFYWIHADSMGHSHGKQAYLEGLRKFDSYLGMAAASGQLDGANIIVYADHGLTTGDVVVVRDKRIIAEMLGHDLNYMFYPNIFLQDPAKKAVYARRIAEETQIDLALIRESDKTILGYYQGGSFEVNGANDKYQYKFSGDDFFGYTELNYNWEFLTSNEWLQLTKDHLFPAAPPILFDYLAHEAVGDIVIVLNDPQISYYRPNLKAHHSGLTSSDMRVPILFTGPAFKDLELPEEIWLNELFSEHLPMVDFQAKKHRERHTFTIKYPLEAELVLSPAYRWRSGVSLSQANLAPWLEFDLISSFFTRFWVGARYGNQKLNWRINAEGFLGDFKVRWLKHQDEAGIISFHWKVSDQLELMATSKKQLGFSFSF